MYRAPNRDTAKRNNINKMKVHYDNLIILLLDDFNV